MGSTIEEVTRTRGSDTEKKRVKVLEKVKTLSGSDLQVIYQSLFFHEIMKTFDQLPKPLKPLTGKEINEAIFKSRKARGFYTKDSN